MCLSEANIKQRHGRTLERGIYEDSVIANRKRILTQREKYKRRQAIVEHPFGTIKRAWGAYYTLLRGKEKVAGEVAIVFTMYNLRRVISILGVKPLINCLKEHIFPENELWNQFRAIFLNLSPNLVLESCISSRHLVANMLIVR